MSVRVPMKTVYYIVIKYLIVKKKLIILSTMHDKGKMFKNTLRVFTKVQLTPYAFFQVESVPNI